MKEFEELKQRWKNGGFHSKDEIIRDIGWLIHEVNKLQSNAQKLVDAQEWCDGKGGPDGIRPVGHLKKCLLAGDPIQCESCAPMLQLKISLG